MTSKKGIHTLIFRSAEGNSRQLEVTSVSSKSRTNVFLPLSSSSQKGTQTGPLVSFTPSANSFITFIDANALKYHKKMLLFLKQNQSLFINFKSLIKRNSQNKKLFLLFGFLVQLKHIKARTELRKHTLLSLGLLIIDITGIAAVLARSIRSCLTCFLSIGCFR